VGRSTTDSTTFPANSMIPDKESTRPVPDKDYSNNNNWYFLWDLDRKWC